MKKLFSFILIVFTANAAYCQQPDSVLQFETRFFDAADKWIAFPKKDKDSSYTVGFIYIDEQAGFTFDYFSEFRPEGNQLKLLPKKFNESLKIRLSEKTSDVAILNQKQIAELGLPKEPEWLHFYKTDTGKTSYYKNIGYHYNHVGASHLAIDPLLKGYAKEPHYKGLEFELSYTYNATKQYEKAIEILEKAIKNDASNFYFYRELGFSYKYLNQIEKSESIYRKGIEISDRDFEKAEMAVNMAQTYFNLKDRKKFDEWATLTRKFAAKDSQYAKYIDYFEQNWGK